MNKEEAMKALREGHKISHRFMLEEEYIYMLNGSLYDEHDCHLDFNDFWKYRQGEQWDKNWFVK